MFNEESDSITDSSSTVQSEESERSIEYAEIKSHAAITNSFSKFPTFRGFRELLERLETTGMPFSVPHYLTILQIICRPDTKFVMRAP